MKQSTPFSSEGRSIIRHRSGINVDEADVHSGKSIPLVPEDESYYCTSVGRKDGRKFVSIFLMMCTYNAKKEDPYEIS